MHLILDMILTLSLAEQVLDLKKLGNFVVIRTWISSIPLDRSIVFDLTLHGSTRGYLQ